ncbi:MAG: tyrosine-type recombinase/integrase, partial [Proteobacteria bacterium]|nr:tyrosine-type recombinase/integrase [Pseudomonadota bacterium]
IGCRGGEPGEGAFHRTDRPALERNLSTVTHRHLNRRSILNIVKKYTRRVGLEADRHERRGIGVHSLRKTAGMSALKHGAKVEQFQAWLGHADIRTTQEYIVYKDEDSEEAARHCWLWRTRQYSQQKRHAAHQDATAVQETIHR